MLARRGAPLVLTVRGYGGLPVAEVMPVTNAQPETVVYYHHDVGGSTVAGTQAGVASAEAYTYGEFGTPFAGGSLVYLFKGYRYDTETGLYYVNARYYSPGLGRFLQPDPIGIGGGANLYAYVGNDPINLTDPLGTSASPQGSGNSQQSTEGYISAFLQQASTEWSNLSPAQQAESAWDYAIEARKKDPNNLNLSYAEHYLYAQYKVAQDPSALNIALQTAMARGYDPAKFLLQWTGLVFKGATGPSYTSIGWGLAGVQAGISLANSNPARTPTPTPAPSPSQNGVTRVIGILSVTQLAGGVVF
jgi:RHS repeat-associated protein